MAPYNYGCSAPVSVFFTIKSKLYQMDNKHRLDRLISYYMPLKLQQDKTLQFPQWNITKREGKSQVLFSCSLPTQKWADYQTHLILYTEKWFKPPFLSFPLRSVCTGPASHQCEVCFQLLVSARLHDKNGGVIKIFLKIITLCKRWI